MFRHSKMRVLLALLPIAVSATAAAQAPPTGPTGLIIDRNRSDRMPPTAPPPAALITREQTATVESAGDRATAIRGIAFEGVKAPAEVAEATRRFVGAPATPANLQGIATAMSAAYARSAVALYTVAIPTQSFADGVVRVRVAEGFIEAVTITGDVERAAVGLVRGYAERIAAERPLTRATLERYLSLIRDVPGLTTDAQLLRGTQPGGVRLVLTLKAKRRDVALSFDNRTSPQFDDGQFQAIGKLFGGLREGDQTELVLATTADLDSYRYAGLSHSTPVGSDGTRLAASVAYLDTQARRTGISGEAEVASLSLSHPVIRSYKRNLTMSASIDGVNSDNAVLGSLIARERTRSARGAVGFSDAAARRSVSAGLTASRGLDILGARVIAPLADATFTKLNARAAIDQAIDQAIGKRFVVRLSGTGQWTRDPLPAVERFTVGGRDFGRAFDVALVAGDRGIAGLGELAFRPKLPALLATSEVYMFGDAADVGFRPRGALAGGSVDLASAGGGVRIALRDKALLELEAARPIDRPFAGASRKWQFNVGWRLSLGR